jgi:hypothetical protein
MQFWHGVLLAGDVLERCGHCGSSSVMVVFAMVCPKLPPQASYMEAEGDTHICDFALGR